MAMTKEKAAWWRGKKVAALGHQVDWYKHALAAYSQEERDAFLQGYNGQQYETAASTLTHD